jgi:hypothetical protein
MEHAVPLSLRSVSSTPGAAARIKRWAVERFGEGDEAWMVTETACVVPGQPPRQTVIALIHPAASIAFRIPKPLDAITADDIGGLGEAAATLAAEGCC